MQDQTVIIKIVLKLYTNIYQQSTSKKIKNVGYEEMPEVNLN